MSLLERIDGPADLRRLPDGDLPALAAEIRAFLVDRVSRSGGHLGPNLGVVELTIALHRVFDSPRDRLLWDTGHQTYVHKVLTGRQGGFDRLRRAGGLSGYPSRAESEHDVIENSHASTALSYADGLARGYQVRGVVDRAVVAVIGDGAMTGGLAWEALNNIGGSGRPLVVVLNDNGRSYAPTVGGLADHLGRLRAGDDETGPGSLFAAIGLTYLGPVDGHDVVALQSVLRRARRAGRPVLVHCVTQKGRGHPAAEQDDAERFHAVAVIDPVTGRPVVAGGRTWTACFAAELLALGRARPDLVAITAAMPGPTGLSAFETLHPERTIDVGIAEQHAFAMAAGLSAAGLHPLIAVYATFLNRAFDQLLMDLALHRCPATVVLDRAGVTGDDGASHNGMWDLTLLQAVPGLRVAAPRDAATLRELLNEACAWREGPTALRFPKGVPGPDLPVLEVLDGMDVLARTGTEEVLVVGAGPMASVGLEVGARLAELGIGVTVVDPRWLLPVSPGLVGVAGRHRLVVTLEDGLREGGFGAAVAQAVREAGSSTRVSNFGLPRRFLPHGRRDDLLRECGLSAEDVVRAVLDDAGLSPRRAAADPAQPRSGPEPARPVADPQTCVPAPARVPR